MADPKLIGTRLSPALYYSFIDYLRSGENTMPSGDLLAREMIKTMNIFAKKTNGAFRKKFKCWSKRMTYSNGVLLYKPTKQEIIPEVDFRNTVKSIHESTPEHLNIYQTVHQIKTRYTWSSKNFGMNLTDVLAVLYNCDKKLCQKRKQTFETKRKPNMTITSVNSPNEDSISVTNDSELITKMFEELMARIRLMVTHIRFCKFHETSKHPDLTESAFP